MGQEFFIKNATLENKVRELLPSQGGLGAGFDLSASTQIIPIVDLTESAEGSNLRSDLQRSFGLNVETYSVNDATDVILTTTGYFRLFGAYRSSSGSTTGISGIIQITDGATTKDIFHVDSASAQSIPFDFEIFLDAGQSCQVVAGVNCRIRGIARQIATIAGELVNP